MEGSLELLCFGEALIDFKTDAQVAAAGVAHSQNLVFNGSVGGSPLNVAVVAARLGVRVALATHLGGDPFADVIHSHLRENGVLEEFLSHGPEPTPLAFALIDGQRTQYSFRLRDSAACVPPRLFPITEDVRALHCGGSISPLFDSLAPVLSWLLEARENRLIHVDPNVRPMLEPDRARYRARLEPWFELGHIIKLSKEDANFLYPGLGELELAQRWLQGSTIAVLVSDGQEGVRLYRRHLEPICVPAVHVQLVDTIGAGDTLSAALLACLLNNRFVPETLEDVSDEQWRFMLEFAVCAAAATCTRAGCDFPVEDFLKMRGNS